MATVSILIQPGRTDAGTALVKESGSARESAIAISNYFAALAGGHEAGTVTAQTDTASPVAASTTFTLTSAIATDAITIGTVTLTASSTPANENQWEIDGASDTLDAASLAAAINAHSVLSKVVSASALSTVVTVTARVLGVVGNQIPTSSADGTIVAASTFLTGGTGGSSGAATTHTFA